MNRKQDIREEKRMEDMTKQKERDVSHAGYGGWIRDIVISPRWMIRFIVGVRLLFRKKIIWKYSSFGRNIHFCIGCMFFRK